MAKLTNASVEKYLRQAREYMQYYMDMPADEFQNEHVTISKGNRKIGKCLNVSLLPVITCVNCKGCAPFCYALRYALRFPENVMKKYAKNTAIMMRDPARFWAEIRDAIRRHRSFRSFRFQVAGDVLTKEYAAEMFETARMFPDRIFWTYTKNPHVLEMNRPSNFSVMDSTGFDKEFDPSRGGQFHCVRRGAVPPVGVYHCPSKCALCVATGRGCPFNENAWIDEH